MSDSAAAVRVEGLAQTQDGEDSVRVLELPSVEIYPIFGDGNRRISLMEHLGIRKELTLDDQASAQGVRIGRQFRPYNYDAILAFKDSNVHHATCIGTKCASTVGQGFLTDKDKKDRESMVSTDPAIVRQPTLRLPFSSGKSKVATVLDALCNNTFQNELNNMIEDYWQVGDGYLEIVRAAGGDKITGIHYLPARNVWVYVEDNNWNYHYEITGMEGPFYNRRFARFGDKKGFFQRVGTSLPIFTAPDATGRVADERAVSEVIHFKQPGASKSRFHGGIDWLSCVPAIELSQCLTQQKYDFYLNRGVPEFMLFLLGKKLAKPDWDIVLNALKATVGKGNSHKSIALNIEDPDVKVELQKLTSDGGKDAQEFQTTSEVLDLKVVTAHRTPPLLAGIQIPGKLGANNELPNALMAYQTLVVGPAQHNIQATLADTLGNASMNGGLGLVDEDFSFKTILDSIDVGIMSTVAGMRQPVTSATAQGRNIGAGLKD